MKILNSSVDVRIEVLMSPEFVARIDRASGQGARQRFIRAAVERELEHAERKIKKG